MLFQIKEIILWPKNHNFMPRRVKFKTGMTNIITGASRTGKSAIIPIVDYCLGSDSCSIPVKTIRDSCEWFGIIIETPIGQKLIARREPGNQLSTGDMFILEGSDIEIPNNIHVNTNVNDVKLNLDQLVGLTNLDFNWNESGSGFNGRPGFRDLSAFIFQPQNIIANPDVLFYKADTYVHREKLQTIFPYVLGAVSSEVLAMQHELAKLRKEFNRKHSEMKSIQQISERWIAEIHSKYSEAKELGLLDITYKQDATKDEMVSALKFVVVSPNAKVNVTQLSIQEANDELAIVQAEELRISATLIDLKKRYFEMSELKKNASGYKEALITQSNRLKISKWLVDFNGHDQPCPICGNEMTSANEDLIKLTTNLEQLTSEIKSFGNLTPSLDREYERVKEELKVWSEKLRGIQIRREALGKTSDEYRQRHYESTRIERFIGNLEKSIEIYESLGVDSDLSQEIEALSEQIGKIEKAVAENEIKARTQRGLGIISQKIARLLPNLDVERPNDPVSLEIKDLTLRIQSVNRSDYLWEVGSGSNWLAYHVAVMLALHQFFIESKGCPVPGFLMIDQPSQVYFPKKLAGRNQTDGVDFSKQIDDEDVEAVRKVYTLIAQVVKSSNGNFQTIILDHAAENVWGNIEGIFLVEEWREGKKLVPDSWNE